MSHTKSENKTLAQRIPLRILLAEDNAINQKLGIKVLEKLGYSTDLAVNGKEVIAACERNQYDIILMDIVMPIMDGFEATKILNELYKNKSDKPFIIALTAHSMPGEREKCIKLGMNDYLSKPLMVDVLREFIVDWALKMDT